MGPGKVVSEKKKEKKKLKFFWNLRTEKQNASQKTSHTFCDRQQLDGCKHCQNKYWSILLFFPHHPNKTLLLYFPKTQKEKNPATPACPSGNIAA